MVMMTLFRNYCRQHSRSTEGRTLQHTPLSLAASISGRSSYKQICQNPDLSKGQPWVSVYSLADGSLPYKTTSDHTPNLI